MIKFLLTCAATAVFTASALAADSLVQRKPDVQAILSALGVHAWQMDFLLPQDRPTGLTVYVKSGDKKLVSLNGTTIYNFKDGPRQSKVTLTIAIQSIFKEHSQTKFLIGVAEGAENVGHWNREIDTPFPAEASWGLAETPLKKDAKGRVILAYSEGTMSLSPGRPIDDYPFAIYLELAPYEEKK